MVLDVQTYKRTRYETPRSSECYVGVGEKKGEEVMVNGCAFEVRACVRSLRAWWGGSEEKARKKIHAGTAYVALMG